MLAVLACGWAGASPAPDLSAAGQLVLVTTTDWNANQGTLRTFARTAQGWRAERFFPVSIGRAGSAWGIGLHPVQAGLQKREGDGRSPAGIFTIGDAFGYAKQAPTALPYVAMAATDWCIDDVDSALYNRIVDAREVGDAAVAGSTEPMRRDLHADGDQRYELGFIIEHNRKATKGAGSCIFAHLWKAPGATTAGCTAMAETDMRNLLVWLRPDAHPLFMLLPLGEYRRLQAAWKLPDIPD
ncbi:MAG TPA: hypothetical protein PKC03_08680 [Dokdonella sp.]|nr:hypothetical protein [Dokdonella sp.]